ncbi:MAG: hypothetical protein QOF51_441 [Chloroflexota bacterium]|nr:hypothetical protein [Chloroflexota bacterium]
MRIISFLVTLGILLASLAAAATPGFAQTPTLTATLAPTSAATSTPTVAPTAATLTPTADTTATGTVVPTTSVTTTPTGVTTPLPTGFSLYVPIAVKGVNGDDSGIQVQNTTGSSGTASVTYYNQNGTAVASDGPAALPPNGSITFYQPANPSLSPGFDGSAVVQATQPIAAIVNRVNYTRSLASAGSITIPPTSNATQVTIPLVYGGLNGYVTTISVMNTSTSTATYTLNLMSNNASGITNASQLTIPANAVRRVRVGVDTFAPGNFIGTAVISSSSASLTAVAETYNAGTSALLSYAGATTGSATTNAPLLFKNYNDWISGVQVANMSASGVTVSASLRDRDSGIAFGLPSVTLGANQGAFFDLSTIAELPDGFVGSGVFTASGPISAVVQEVNAVQQTGMGYDGFSAGTSNISIPLIFKGSGGWDTGVQVQNLGSVETAVTIVYTLPSGITVSEVATVAAGDSVTFYQPANPNLPSGLVGAATVTSSGQPIVAIVNEVNYARGGDAAMAYEGINY